MEKRESAIAVQNGVGRKAKCEVPEPPPRSHLLAWSSRRSGWDRVRRGYTSVPVTTKEAWDRLFTAAQRADVRVKTELPGFIIHAHSCVLSVASPVMKNILGQSKDHHGCRELLIRGVPQAVEVFIRFLYSSCYENEDLDKYGLHLMVLSHVFAVPALKHLCVWHLESGVLSNDNVVDIYQLSRLCDAPRLILLCHRLILKNFRAVSDTEGWKVMKQTNPKLEQELLESLVEADSMKKERLKKMEDKKIYMKLYEAMEALVHICRDRCRTIGPHDKVLNGSKTPCNFPECKGLESLIQHFAGCKSRIPGGCIYCKRMWLLLELHSRMCSEPDLCKVPLCRHFKEKIQQNNKNDEINWKLLVAKVFRAKNTALINCHHQMLPCPH